MRYLIFSLLITTSLMAEVLKKNPEGDYVLTNTTFKASEILADYAKLNNLNLNIVTDFDDKSFTTQGNHKISKYQIDKYVSTLIARSGNAIIRSLDSAEIQVVQGRDIRFATLPVYNEISKVPETDEGVQFNYTIKNIKASELSRNIRPFLSRYGRVIDMASANTIHLTDTGRNVIRMTKLLQYLDTEENAKSQKEVDELNEKHKKIFSNEKSLWQIVSENNGLFIFAFLLIGIILGFGTRGYMMKKVEGGW